MLSFAFGAICSALFLCITVLHIISGVFALPYGLFAISYAALLGCIVRGIALKKDKTLVGCAGFACVFWAFGDYLMLQLSGSLPAKQEIPPIVEWKFSTSMIWLAILLLLSVCTIPLAGKCAFLYKKSQGKSNPQKQLFDGQKGAIGGIVWGTIIVGLLKLAEFCLEPAQYSMLMCFALLFVMFMSQTASIAFWIYHRSCK